MADQNKQAIIDTILNMGMEVQNAITTAIANAAAAPPVHMTQALLLVQTALLT